ncbi:MAG: aminoacyl-tRNA hydrolase [Synergistaceae bacterium]|nr:aminoacyl-tRNA hydrolase [Synergistaceae bacterium]
MKLIVGLGNPGVEYAFTRHNMGWMAVDHLALRYELGKPQLKFRGEAWRASGSVLLKPLTFMNLSGAAVREAFDFYKMEPEDVLVICDDLALPYGRLRLRAQGSDGGHNGLASILGALGTAQVPRLRIGLGRGSEGMVGRVLGRLTPQEMDLLPAILDRIQTAVEAWLGGDIQVAMSRVNAPEPGSPAKEGFAPSTD